MKMLDDAQLAALAAGGDAEAFEELVVRHADTVFRMAWRWCANRADAEDITQEVFMKLARKMHCYSGGGKFTTWLYQVTLNEARDHLRGEKRRHGYETEFSAGRAESHDPAPQIEAREVSRMLERLPQEQKEAMMLVICQGVSHRDAANILGCAEKTVAWRIHEARRKMKEWYGNV